MFVCISHLEFESDRICHVLAKSDFLIIRPHFPVVTASLPCLVSVKFKGPYRKVEIFFKWLKLSILSNHSVVTAHKQSLGQGNVFTSVCQYFCSQGEGGVMMSLPVKDSTPWTAPLLDSTIPDPSQLTSGRYASYWNSFLLTSSSTHRSFLREAVFEKHLNYFSRNINTKFLFLNDKNTKFGKDIQQNRSSKGQNINLRFMDYKFKSHWKISIVSGKSPHHVRKHWEYLPPVN